MSHIVEEESGTFVARGDHAHNGYYAGDFADVPFNAPNLQPLLTLRGHTA